MGKRHWPIHPQPLADELLSSWMIRVARDNGFKVHNFYADHFGRERQIWNRDIDHHAPTWLLDGLETYSGVPHTRLEALTLRAFESIAYERLNETGNTRLLMPLSIFHRTRRAYGQQFCPLCLATDKTPYLRRRWRLALVVVCVRHGVLLQDRCGNCGRPLAPHHSDMKKASSFPERSTMRQCGHCGRSILAPPILVSRAALDTQQHLNQALDNGFVSLSTEKVVYSHLYFDGLRQLMVGLSRCSALRDHHITFERAGVYERLTRLQCAVALLEGWPYKFLAFCSGIKQPYTVFTRDARPMPHWFDCVLREHLLFRRSRLFLAEAQAIVAATEASKGRFGLLAARSLSGRDVSKFLPKAKVPDDVADILLASLDLEIGLACDLRRTLLLRDKIMFIAGRVLHLTIPQLLELRSECFACYEGCETSFWDRIDTKELVGPMLNWYVSNVRPKLLRRTHSETIFPTYTGAALQPSAVGSRFGRAVRIALLERAIPSWKEWVAT